MIPDMSKNIKNIQEKIYNCANCYNFFVFQYFFINILLRLDLPLIRTNPGSFVSRRGSKEVSDIPPENVLLLAAFAKNLSVRVEALINVSCGHSCHISFLIDGSLGAGYPHGPQRVVKTPDSCVSGADLTAVKFL